MKYLFSTAGLQRLDEIVRPGLLCAFDFDGTLTPIVSRPDKVQLSPAVSRRLKELAHFVPVAILTGRSLDDIRARLGFTPEFLIGNHGLEGVPGWELLANGYGSQCQTWMDTLSAMLAGHQTLSPDIWIENKRCSLSVHYRLARDRIKTEKQLLQLIGTLSPRPRVMRGKCVFNLLPEEVVHKGSALEQLMDSTGAAGAIYVGDDVTDEDVFRLRRQDLLSVRIERDNGSAAECYLYDSVEIAQLLDQLLLMVRHFKDKQAPVD